MQGSSRVTLSVSSGRRARAAVLALSGAQARDDELLHHADGADGRRTATPWPDGTAELRPAADVTAYVDASGTPTHLTWHVGLGGPRQVGRLAAPLGASGASLPPGTAPVVYLHQGFGPGTTLITGAGGEGLEERLFEPFGANILASADDALEPHGWNAKPVDPHREWSDHGARWHATPLGRWTAADPPLRHPSGLLDHGLNASTSGFVPGNPKGPGIRVGAGSSMSSSGFATRHRERPTGSPAGDPRRCRCDPQRPPPLHGPQGRVHGGPFA